jgi:ABC-type multidrug transport system fused ATPase/permease subunit
LHNQLVWKNTVSSDALKRAANRSDSLAHVNAAGWGRGLFTLVRITHLTLRHPWQSTFTIGSTLIAASLQLMIPRLLGHAVEQTQTAMAGGAAGKVAENALLMTALVLLTVSILRARIAFMAAHETNSVANGALAEAIHGVRAVQSMDRQSISFTLYDDRAHANLKAHLAAANPPSPISYRDFKM